MPRTKDAKNTLGELDAKTVSRLVGAASDVALVCPCSARFVKKLIVIGIIG